MARLFGSTLYFSKWVSSKFLHSYIFKENHFYCAENFSSTFDLIFVSIRQWGVNAGRSVASQIKEKPKQSGGADLSDLDNAIDAGEIDRGGSFLDDGDEDDEDDGEVADDEILYVLNVEGYRKLNAYAHSVNPISPGVTAALAPAPVFDSSEQQQQAQQLPTHPSLVLLGEAVKASAGKMEHSVLDRAATACQRFYGGSTVFCKSGKDRTAMQVTFKQAQFVQRFIDRKGGSLLEDTQVSYDEVVAKSALMRKYGTRIPVCEKNAGEPKFAFNPLQRKFMPEMLRPDASLCTWSKPETWSHIDIELDTEENTFPGNVLLGADVTLEFNGSLADK